jgi:hypothetical protein
MPGPTSMRTLTLTVVYLAMCGCQPPSPASSAAVPQVTEAALPQPAVFATWPTITDKPIYITGADPTPCRAALNAEDMHGPHGKHVIVVRVNPEARAAFLAGTALPLGSVVVKEKYADEKATGARQGYALMVKRTPGYFPAGGDWEYVFVNENPNQSTSRGQLTECATCHASQGDRDYLFRSYGER